MMPVATDSSQKNDSPATSRRPSPAPSTHSSGEQQRKQKHQQQTSHNQPQRSSTSSSSHEDGTATGPKSSGPSPSRDHLNLQQEESQQQQQPAGVDPPGPPPPPHLNVPPPPPFMPFHSSPSHMPHRVEPYAMNYAQRRAHNPHYDVSRHTTGRPSPPPIATLATSSPSLSVSSLDRSAVSTPNPTPGSGGRRSPPYQGGYSTGGPPPPPVYNQNSSRYPPGPGSYGGYPPHEPYDSRYAPPGPPPMDSMHHPHHATSPSSYGMHHPSHPHHPPHPHHNPHMPVHHGMPAPPPEPSGYSNTYPVPGQNGLGPGYPVQFTDDAATKLSDRVRRRCFNCCTSDTSTWRRSNLNPGKVLCNKCGLFERTHSRPRPEQFPHKRGPLATSTLAASVSASRSPPSTHATPNGGSGGHTQSGGPPPPYNYVPPSSSDTKQRSNSVSGTPSGPGFTGPLPGVQSWHPQDHHQGHGHPDSNANSAASRSPHSRRPSTSMSGVESGVKREDRPSRGGSPSPHGSSSNIPMKDGTGSGSRSHSHSLHGSPKDMEGMQRTLTPPSQKSMQGVSSNADS